LLPVGDEEAFTALLEHLPEEVKRLLERFQYPIDDPGLIEAFLTRLLETATVPGLPQEPDETSKYIKHCLKDPPLHRKPSEAASYSPTQLLQLCFMILLRNLTNLSALPPDSVATLVKEDIRTHVLDLQSQAKLGSERRERPLPYPHENVVFHAAHLRGDAMSQQEPPAGSGVIYERGRIMTVAEASRVSGVKLGTLHNDLNDGKLTVRGRIFSPAPGGGKVLVDLDQVMSLPRRPKRSLKLE
jgi:hypothetical protein